MGTGIVVKDAVVSPMRELRFFNFRQNNSGGSFDYDPQDGISVNVIIQARDVQDANNRARQIGLYFDGCDMGRDCSCCGDRWYEQWDGEEGDVEPSINGEPVEGYNFNSGRWMKWVDGYEAFVHYYDGRIEGFGASLPKVVEVKSKRKELS